MYKHILVAVDGSSVSDQALREAIALAKNDASALRLVHVVDMGVLPLAPELGIDLDAQTRARRAAGEKILGAARKAASDAGLKVEAELLETGTPAQHVSTVIVTEAARWPADLIVLGSHGHRAVVRLVLGSVADGVLRTSTVPVLLIPPR